MLSIKYSSFGNIIFQYIGKTIAFKLFSTGKGIVKGGANSYTAAQLYRKIGEGLFGPLTSNVWMYDIRLPDLR